MGIVIQYITLLILYESTVILTYPKLKTHSKERNYVSMIKMYTDASTKNDPGPSGVGIIISTENRYHQLSFPLEKNLSNHEAEFEALLRGLTYLIDHQLNHETLMMYTDSKLLASAIKKEYVKKDTFKSYLILIQEKLNEFPLFFIHWIPESHNKGADHLAKQALQKIISKK